MTRRLTVGCATIAPPRDTASVFFHRSPRWPSPSSRPEHDLENLQALNETMRPEDTWSETVIASEPISLQAARRLSIRGWRAPVPQCAASRYVWAATRKCKGRPRHGPHPFPLHDVKQPAAWFVHAARLVPAARLRVRVGASVSLGLRHLHRISAAFAGASAGSRPNPWRQLQLRPRNEGAGGAPGGVLPVVALV